MVEVLARTGRPADTASPRAGPRQRPDVSGVGPVALAIFDQLSIGIVLLDRSARVLFANAAARTMAGGDGPLHVDTDITKLCCEHARCLGDIVRSVLANASTRTISLPAPSDGGPRLIIASPIQQSGIDLAETHNVRSAAVLLLICDPDGPTRVPAAWLMEAYGLTLAEERVAMAAASGAAIPTIARRLGVSVNTVKTHLRRVFAKTGTCRQSQLSRLLAMIGVGRGLETQT